MGSTAALGSLANPSYASASGTGMMMDDAQVASLMELSRMWARVWAAATDDFTYAVAFNPELDGVDFEGPNIDFNFFDSRGISDEHYRAELERIAGVLARTPADPMALSERVLLGLRKVQNHLAAAEEARHARARHRYKFYVRKTGNSFKDMTVPFPGTGEPDPADLPLPTELAAEVDDLMAFATKALYAAAPREVNFRVKMHTLRARLLELRREYAKAAAEMRAGIAVWTDGSAVTPDPVLLTSVTVYQGYLCEKAGNDTAALERYTQVIELDGRQIMGWINRANLRKKRGEFGAAMSDYLAVAKRMAQGRDFKSYQIGRAHV